MIENVSVHPLCADLEWTNSRLRLLALAEELQLRPDGADVVMGGKLRDPRQYGPTSSEFLAARLLRAFGQPQPQPFKNRLGPDYLVGRKARGSFAAEVKSLRQSVRSDRAERAFAAANRSYQGVTPERDFGYEAGRLYTRVKHAAKQLGESAKRGLPGLVLLDLAGDTYLTNLFDRICSWMDVTEWAGTIDAVFFVDHVPQAGGWGAVARPVCWRDDAFWSDVIAQAGGRCTLGHVHVGYAPPNGACDYGFI